MQKLQVYGQPRLPIIGTILKTGALRERRLDELPALLRRRAAPAAAAPRCRRSRAAGAASSPRSTSRTIGPVGEAEDVVEVLPGVLRIAARVRAAEDGDGAARAEQVAERVGELRAPR